MTRFVAASRALLEAALPGLDLADDGVEAPVRFNEASGEDDSDDKRTVALAVVSAVLIAALVVYGCFRMCTSSRTMERAANFLTSRAEGSYMSYTSNDGLYLRDAAMQPKAESQARPQMKPTLPTLPED